VSEFGVIFDFDRRSRPQQGNFDIGAFEFYEKPIVLSQEEHTQGLQISPNPASEFIHISNLDLLQTEKIEVTNVQGVILQRQDKPIGNKIDVSNLPDGIYLVKVFSGGYCTYLKFVKK
jgi:hypothetical protein